MFNKTSLLFYFLTLISFSGKSQNTLIPDPNFEQTLIDLGYDTAPINGSVPTININNITLLEISAKNISDLTGIEDFTNLSVLECTQNQLTSIDVSNNLNLTQLFVDQNQLTNIDVTNNSLLQILWCDENQITSLDVTQNLELISLDCGDNQLNTLDVTNNTKLNVFICDRNQLSSIDVSNNILLEVFFCDYNSFTNIDTSNNPDLKHYNCGDNIITNLDVSTNIKLTHLWVTRNQLSNLDVSKNTELVNLVFGQNQILDLNVSTNLKIKRLWGDRNLLTNLDTSKNVELIELGIPFNNLTSLDLSNNTKLERLICVDNLLCFINIQNGNNTLITDFEATLNPFLSCVFVDDVSYSAAQWMTIDPDTNFVLTQSDCDALGNGTPEVDIMNDFVGSSFTLPPLLNGTYYTEPFAGGQQLLEGTVITTSQTIYIYNSTQCYANESSFNVVITQGDYYIPKYFTPNNDSNHDTWKVIDNTGSFTSINIYNRHGKLLKSLLPNNFEWDGTFRGEMMYNDDYWFVINRITDNPIKGHFTLKR